MKNSDLWFALLRTTDCTCEEHIDTDGDERLPRRVWFTDPSCIDHGELTGRVGPDLDDIHNEAWEEIGA